MAKTSDLQNSFKSTAMLETTVLQLKKENKALSDTVSKLLAELNKLRDLDTGTLTTLILTPEEEICDLQIRQIQQLSRERKLTLEEIKALDLLIKNKRLIKKQSTANNEFNILPSDNISEDELLRIIENGQEKDVKGSKPQSS